MSKKYAAIDYSFTSPGIAIKSGDTYNLYNICDVKKAHGTFSVDNFIIQSEPMIDDYENNPDRWDQISDWAIGLLKMWDIDHVFLEDYAYGARAGLIFQIAENTGLLKYKMMKEGITFDIIPPKEIKLFATGKGNANKDALLEAFEEENSINIKKLLNLTDKQSTPSSDVIDAYFILKQGLSRADV